MAGPLSGYSIHGIKTKLVGNVETPDGGAPRRLVCNSRNEPAKGRKSPVDARPGPRILISEKYFTLQRRGIAKRG
jgi:hypothetical protein